MPTVHVPDGLVATQATGRIIDGLLWGWHWRETNWGYSFPTTVNEYATEQPGSYNGYLGYGYENVTGFAPFNSQQQAQIVAAVGAIETYIPVSFKSNATLGTTAPVVFRFAIADSIDYGYGVNGIGEQYAPHGPGGGRSAEAVIPDPFQMNWRAAGDTWYIANAYDAPVPGNFSNAAGLLHEFGHALGLKHGHHQQPVFNGTNAVRDANGNLFADPVQVGTAPTLPTQYDSQEFSIMTYRVYVGDDPGQGNEAQDIRSNQVDYPWSYMMLDIAALQYMYGANYGAGSNPGNTVYIFNSSTGQMSVSDSNDGTSVTAPSKDGKIFTTIWDGGGSDTYDFSNYSTDQVINLQPGFWSTFSSAQVARLGTNIFAQGNIANALQYQNNFQSLIENANGGTGNDVLIGNVANNVLYGNRGNDQLDGGAGNDTAVFSGARADYAVFTASSGKVYVADAASGRDGKDTLQNVENIKFGSVTGSVASALIEPPDADNSAFQVYRFYNSQTGSHFFTTSLAERNSVIENLDAMSFEGNSFDSNVTDVNGTAVFRFFNFGNNAHFYTANAGEAAGLRQDSNFRDEGISYYASNDASNGGTELFRFFNTLNGTHFYTVSAAERDNIISTLGHYNYEGTAFYVDVA